MLNSSRLLRDAPRVSITAVPMMASEPPSSTSGVAPKKRFGS
jgi:hypothetical protein